MSNPDIRYPAVKALEVAVELCQQISDRTTRIIIAGSLRRKKPLVGDVEILYVPRIEQRPRPGNMFEHDDHDLAAERIEALVKSGVLIKRPNKAGHFNWGDRQKYAIHKPSGIPIDLFATTDANWWVSLVVRTGSLETNMKLTTGAQALGKSLNAFGCGVTDDDGKVTPAVSEKHVFELCGVAYLEPQER